MNDTWRRAIYVEGLDHGSQPIPNACRVGDIVWSGGVSGIDPSTGAVPASVRDEVRQMFTNVCSIATEAGVRVEDIGRMTFFVRQRDPVLQEALNTEWTSMFPEPMTRPAPPPSRPRHPRGASRPVRLRRGRPASDAMSQVVGAIAHHTLRS